MDTEWPPDAIDSVPSDHRCGGTVCVLPSPGGSSLPCADHRCRWALCYRLHRYQMTTRCFWSRVALT
eukprot:scaffold335745_cov14-Prasinocladus_malaysianus.AAC.3